MDACDWTYALFPIFLASIFVSAAFMNMLSGNWLFGILCLVFGFCLLSALLNRENLFKEASDGQL